jgi:hypothetical protein
MEKESDSQLTPGQGLPAPDSSAWDGVDADEFVRQVRDGSYDPKCLPSNHWKRIKIGDYEVAVSPGYLQQEQDFVGPLVERKFYESEGEEKEFYRQIILKRRDEFYEITSGMCIKPNAEVARESGE